MLGLDASSALHAFAVRKLKQRRKREWRGGMTMADGNVYRV
jgi:hypothetical protein